MKKERFFYLETAGIAFSLIGFFLKLAKLPAFGEWILGFGIGFLAVVYLMYITLPHQQGYDFLSEGISKYLVSGTYFVVLFGVIGLFFKLSLTEGGQEMLKIASYANLALVILLLFALRIADNITQFESTKLLLVRALIMLAVVYMFFLTPQKRLEKVFGKVPEKNSQELRIRN